MSMMPSERGDFGGRHEAGEDEMFLQAGIARAIRSKRSRHSPSPTSRNLICGQACDQLRRDGE